MKAKRFLFFPLFGIAGLLIGGLVVMWLWNAILPVVTSAETLTYWQGVGLLLLCRILFGGWRGGKTGGGYNRHSMNKHAQWRNKWKNMSAEERIQLQQQWRERCRRKGDEATGRRGSQESQRPSDEELL